MKKIILKPGREKSLLRRHPWVFSGAILQDLDRAIPGETVRLVTEDGEFLAFGAYSPHSQIRVRIWTFKPDEKIDDTFFRKRLDRAIMMRSRLIESTTTNAYRLINAESDGLPGLIVDKYAGYIVCQFLSAGVEYFKELIVDQLRLIFKPEAIYERSDTEARKKEGLAVTTGMLYGNEPPETIVVEQDGIRFLVNIRQGHKTGMYLDQRENRNVIKRYAKGAKVLNCFAYTGAFTLSALRGGASSVTNIESSADVLAMIVKNTELNVHDVARLINVQGDAFQVLRDYRESGEKFDLVVLDPPKFIHSAQQIQRGCRGYKDINLLAMKLLNENGLLITFSCSGHLSPELFQKVVAAAALDAGRTASMVSILGQPSDHPVALNFPEGGYLKGLVCYLG
ncbi:MAG: class I SAM-dependent rRNA methyltransferase [Gammaproteobacteria bacterium]